MLYKNYQVVFKVAHHLYLSQNTQAINAKEALANVYDNLERNDKVKFEVVNKSSEITIREEYLHEIG